MLLYSLGAKLPPPPAHSDETNSAESTGQNEESKINEEQEELEELELDMSAVIKGEEEDLLPMGDDSKEVIILDIISC